MNLDDLTVRELRELRKLFGPDVHTPMPGGSPREQGAFDASLSAQSWEIGKIYLIRTVTMIDTGRLVAVTPQELVLEDAAWIADTGRFADALVKAEFGEVEPFPDGRVIVGRGAVIDAVQISKAPRTQK